MNEHKQDWYQYIYVDFLHEDVCPDMYQDFNEDEHIAYGGPTIKITMDGVTGEPKSVELVK